MVIKWVPPSKRHMVGKRDSVGAQSAQPAISDSWSVLHQQQFQPVSRKVHATKRKGGSEQRVWRRMRFQSRYKVYQYILGEEMYQYILAPPTGYLLLNLENLGRGMEGTRTFCFSPSNFGSNFFSGISLFCQEASANKPIQVKPALLSLFVLDRTQWGSMLPGCILFDSRECRVFGQFISLSPVCEPSHPAWKLDGNAHQPPW